MFWDRTVIEIRKSSAHRVSSIGIMTAIGFACMLLLFNSSVGFAEGNSHRCEVAVVDNNTDTMSKIGVFTTTVKSEELITKSFRFPGSELFVTVSVLYMQEPPFAKGDSPGEIILTLLLGKKAYTEIETEMKEAEVIGNAKAIVPLKSFYRAQVGAIFLGRKQPVIITLECRK